RPGSDGGNGEQAVVVDVRHEPVGRHVEATGRVLGDGRDGATERIQVANELPAQRRRGRCVRARVAVGVDGIRLRLRGGIPLRRIADEVVRASYVDQLRAPD